MCEPFIQGVNKFQNVINFTYTKADDSVGSSLSQWEGFRTVVNIITYHNGIWKSLFIRVNLQISHHSTKLWNNHFCNWLGHVGISRWWAWSRANRARGRGSALSSKSKALLTLHVLIVSRLLGWEARRRRRRRQKSMCIRCDTEHSMGFYCMFWLGVYPCVATEKTQDSRSLGYGMPRGTLTEWHSDIDIEIPGYLYRWNMMCLDPPFGSDFLAMLAKHITYTRLRAKQIWKSSRWVKTCCAFPVSSWNKPKPNYPTPTSYSSASIATK